MLTRDQWISAGFDALDQEGYLGVSAERLARRLNVTRGSFYHHFRSKEDFVRILLVQWESDYTDPLVAEYQERVDRTRLSFAISVCSARIDNPVDAELIARFAHLCLIGGQQSGDRNQPSDFSRLARTALTLLGSSLRPSQL
ncbi:TetR/AcrR family transcriptional regulator [Paraburkholderia bryophila]|uniref:TetR family transcriptional regulator n=1 Tax=Paraburkholderia bryophila TaxID=420952 RepID=A0A329CV90_9BURK|nr:TetR/AcrR family transcriptional regulator [Paraburkholderia bryophila]RAS38676.1 TetR family transcriptional regulator [Paraburkholderia bryophila]